MSDPALSDPARVMRAVNEVRAALAGWQEAATEAMSAAREEHQGLSARVQESGESAVRVRTRAANLAQDLAGLESSVADTRASLAAAAAAVERRVRTHHELTDHVTQTHAVWSGHVERAEDDHATAINALNWALQIESDARHDFETARAQAGGAQSESEWAARQEELAEAEARYNVAVSQRQRAEASVAEQRERVARYRQALGLAQQAVEVLQSTATHVDYAVQAVQSGQQRLSEVEAATSTAQAHLVRMAGYADEAVSHAGEADQHLTSASLHLDEAENWYQRGHLLAMDAGGEMADILQELQRIDAPMEGDGAAGSQARDLADRSAQASSSRRFGTGRRPHRADITIMRNGQSITRATIDSGGMTDEERALGFPRSSLATHTEARAIKRFKLEPGDTMHIRGEYPPCSSCKGAMNMTARQEHATIIYKWPNGEWAARG